MKLSNTYKKSAIIACVAVLFFIILQSIAAKSAVQNSGSLAGYFIFTLVILLILSGIFFIIFKLTGSEIRNKYYELFEKEKTQLKVDEVEEVKEEEKSEVVELTLDELKAKLIPEATFKYLDSFAEKLLINFGRHFQIVQGLCYYKNEDGESYRIIARYASFREKEVDNISLEDGITGQAIADKEIKAINDIPAGYINVESGLGNADPAQLLFIPVIQDDIVIALFELATFKEFNEQQIEKLNEFSSLLSDLLPKFKTR